MTLQPLFHEKWKSNLLNKVFKVEIFSGYTISQLGHEAIKYNI